MEHGESFNTAVDIVETTTQQYPSGVSSGGIGYRQTSLPVSGYKQTPFRMPWDTHDSYGGMGNKQTPSRVSWGENEYRSNNMEDDSGGGVDVDVLNWKTPRNWAWRPKN